MQNQILFVILLSRKSLKIIVMSIKFKIRVWFRYAANGEQEKECEDFEVEALGIHDAFKKIQSRYFTNLSSIPFQYGQVINGTVYMWYKPFGSYMSEDFNKKLSEIENKY